jgi:hypothetical protein
MQSAPEDYLSINRGEHYERDREQLLNHLCTVMEKKLEDLKPKASWGGRMWAAIRTGEATIPWDNLKRAGLWTKSNYATLRTRWRNVKTKQSQEARAQGEQGSTPLLSSALPRS